MVQATSEDDANAVRSPDVVNTHPALTSEALIDRANSVWDMFKDIWHLDKLNVQQRSGVMNVIFEAQRREHRALGFELPQNQGDRTE